MAKLQPVGGDGESAVFAEINMIPFIDVALVLLIIFMVLSPMLVQAALPLDLPGAATAAPAQDQTVAISLSPEGAVYFEDQQVDDAALATLVRERLLERPEVLFIIKADGQSPYRQVITLADQVRQAGGTKLAFATSPETMQAPPVEEAPEAQPATSR